MDDTRGTRFESLQEGFGNCGELVSFERLGCQEVSGGFIIVSITFMWLYEQTCRAYIQSYR